MIPQNFDLDTSDIITIRGVTSGRLFSIGSITIDLHFNNVVFEHKFHVVDENFDIPTQGILGKDFLKPNAFCIDYEKMVLSTTIDGIKIVTDIRSEMDPMMAIIPANSEIFRIFHINSKEFPCIIPYQSGWYYDSDNYCTWATYMGSCGKHQ